MLNAIKSYLLTRWRGPLKLQTSILIWVMAAGVLPLAILGFGVTAYSEQQYQDKVADQVRANLENIESEMTRQIFYDGEIIKSLGNSPRIREYKEVLAAINQGQVHKQLFPRSERLSLFLESFQTVLPDFATIRIVTLNNHTIIKVQGGKGQVGSVDGIESSPYVEESSSPKVAERLKELPRNDVSYLLLPVSKWDWEDLRGPPMFNAVLPLTHNNQLVGYLVITFSGSQIDRLLSTATRLYRGTLLIAELNPDDKERHGLMLFNDSQSLKFNSKDATPISLRLVEGGRLWEIVQSSPQGDYVDPDKLYRTFYREYLPYNNRLISWVLAIRIDLEEVRAPFKRIRLGILLLTAVAVIISLVLARYGAKRISKPVIQMSDSLKQYADGDHSVRVTSEGADEIQQLEASFNYMADNLDKAQHMMLQSAKLASIGQMAAGIGHEINNPLNNILSLTKLMQKTTPAEDTKTHADLKSLREECERASEIIRGVLNFARQVPPTFAEFALSPWLHETIRLVNQAAKNKMVELICVTDIDLQLTGDRNQLQQVLVNLLLNAIDASDYDSVVEIKATHRDDEVVIEVIDSGSGLSEEAKDKIFDPFFTTKSEGEGTGLGLSISIGIIERHNGQLVLENNPNGKGVTATIVLPLQPESELDPY